MKGIDSAGDFAAASHPLGGRRRAVGAVVSFLLFVVAASIPSAAYAIVGEGPVFGGTFVLLNGKPAAGFTVSVTAMDSATTIQIGQARTNPDGSWSSAIRSLTPGLRAAAEANDGVLNVQATAFAKSQSRDRDFVGVMHLQLGLSGVDGKLSQAAVDARKWERLSAPLLPIHKKAELGSQPTAAEYGRSFAAQETANPTAASRENAKVEHYRFLSATTNSRTPVNPAIIGGIDYTNDVLVPLTSQTTTKTDNATVNAGEFCSNTGATRNWLVVNLWEYTAVGEHHAYWDATGQFVYNSVANSDYSVGYTYNYGSTWGASGTYHVGNTWGFGIGSGRQGPNYAKVMKIPMKYERWRLEYCDDVTLRWTYGFDNVAAKAVDIPNGWTNMQPGNDLAGLDGYQEWNRAPYKIGVYPGSNFILATGRTVTYSYAANVFGFGVSGSTGRSTNRQQEIYAGTQGNNDSHQVFAWSCLTCNPPTFYSY